MVVRVENGYEVSNQTIVAEDYAVGGHDSGTGVNKDTLAEHKGSTLGSAHLNRHCLTAQKQTSTGDRAKGEKHRLSPVHSHDGGSRTCPAEFSRGPEAPGHVPNLDHRSHPRKSSKLPEVANRRRHAGLETIIDLVIIDLVKSGAGTARADGCQMGRERGTHVPSCERVVSTRRAAAGFVANTIVTGLEATFSFL